MCSHSSIFYKKKTHTVQMNARRALETSPTWCKKLP